MSELILAGLAIWGVCLLAWSRPSLAKTTLTLPWIWSLAALAGIIGCELWVELALPAEHWLASHLRYAAGCLTFAPLMAVLGAKRPQHRGWQFVVLCLLAVLLLPSAEALLFVPGRSLSLFGARPWFLVILLSVGILNYLFTRWWPSALLYAAGQCLLLAEQWPWPFPVTAWSVTAGVACLILALALVRSGIPPRRAVEHPVDRLWLDFRDAYGALWALRVAERFNAAADLYDWEVHLGWQGMLPREKTGRQVAEVDQQESMDQVLDNLLRRFVSPAWIQTRRSG